MRQREGKGDKGGGGNKREGELERDGGGGGAEGEKGG